MNETRRTELVARASDGDVDALQRLMVEYHAPLRAAVEKALDGDLARRLESDDLMQEAYAAAFVAIADCHFDTPAAFYRWLETVALNQARNARRAQRAKKRDVAREQRADRTAATSYPDLIARLSAGDTTPSRLVARTEASAAVLSSLARLPEDQREAIRLRFLEDMSVSEVARCLGKTDAAIHGLCRRGLRGLREFMASMSHYLTKT